MSFVQAAGLDRTDSITFACINPENALFYRDNVADESFPPTSISSILYKIEEANPQSLVNKTINVIMNDSFELGGTESIKAELNHLAKQYNFRLNIISPEIEIFKMINKKVQEVAKNKKEGEIVVTLVGQGIQEEDQQMLHNFQTELKSHNYENIDSSRVRVNLIQKKDIDGISIDGNVKRKDQEQLLKVKLNESDLVFVYGDKDHGTTTLLNLLVGEGLNTPREKIHAIVEKPSYIAEADRYLSNSISGVSSSQNPNIHCIYEMVLHAFDEAQSA
jgi:hypothetical protein